MDAGSAARRVALGLGDSPETLWRQLARPWLQQYGPEAWRAPGPVVVLVPHRAAGFYLKERALEEGLHLMGVEFWTPTEVRRYFDVRLTGAPGATASREALDLLLRLAARHVLARQADNRAAASIQSDPAAFRQVLDQVLATGLDPADLFSSDLRAVIRQWQRLLADAKLIHSAETAFALEAAARGQAPVLAACLCLGFSGQHGPQTSLVLAALRASETGAVGLLPPESPGEWEDQLWISTLEEQFGGYQMLATQEAEAAAPPPLLLAGASLHEEARVIAAQVARWLAEDAAGPAGRIGVAVPPGGELGLLVTAELSRLGLPLHSRFGYRRPGMLEDAAWRAWLAFLAEPLLPPFLALSRALEPGVLQALAGAAPTAVFDASAIERAMEKAYESLLSPDLRALATWLEASATGHAHARFALTAKVVRALDSLEASAPLEAHWQRLERAGRALGFSERVELLAPRAADLRESGLELTMPRADFAAWLLALSDSWEFARPEEAGHYYARVHVLSPAEAAGQTWSHLLLAGQAEGEYPPPRSEDAFLSQQEQRRLHARLRERLTARVGEGGQGEGQDVLPPGTAWYRGAGAAADAARRDFAALWRRRETGTTLALSTHLTQESRPALSLMPGEFFLHAHRHCGEGAGGPLNGEACRRLADESRRRTHAVLGADLPPRDDHPALPVEAAAEARRQRARGGTYGPYDFALQPGATPPRPLRLSCGEWERVLRAPATSFLRHVLGAREPAAFNLPAFRRRSLGTWTHAWLGAMVPPGESAPNAPPPLTPWPGEAVRLERLRRRAHRFRGEATAALAAADRALPAWWLAQWEEALGMAVDLAGQIADKETFPHAATEWSLEERPLEVGAAEPLALRGRLDCLLGATGDWRISPRLRILDFKTGSQIKFTLRDVQRKGSGVQLALYALLLNDLVEGDVEVGLASAREGLSALVPAVDFLQLEAGWQELARMQAGACFGWRHPLRDAYRQVETLPLATLPGPEDVGRAKWRASHPAWEALA